MHVSGLFTHPIKSCRAVSLERAELTAFGVRHDREWMVTRPDGLFLSQRVLPRMALISADVTETHLVVSAPGVEDLLVDLNANSETTSTATVWKQTLPVRDEGDDAARWLREFLGRDCRLVRAAGERTIDEPYRKTNAQHDLHCADGFPLLITSTATLEQLNAVLPNAVAMNRFRPNIVIAGDDLEPGAEDYWNTVRIGDVTVHIVKPCERCPIPDTDQEAGVRLNDVKPGLMQVRHGYRVDKPDKLATFFGQNAIFEGELPLTINVGDVVEVIEANDEANVVIAAS